LAIALILGGVTASSVAVSAESRVAGPDVTPDPVGTGPFQPNALAVSPDGVLYASDCGAGRVFRVEPGAQPVSVVGLGSMFQPFDGEGGPAWAAHLQCPIGVSFDQDGRMLVVDHGHGRVRRVEADGTLITAVGGDGQGVTGSTPAVQAHLQEPNSVIAGPAGELFVTDRSNRIFRVGADGTIATFAGTGTAGFSGDGGPAIEAQLDGPAGLALDAAGGLYVADSNNERIRRIDPSGIITTVAGNGEHPALTADGAATDDAIADPESILLRPNGDLIVGEADRNRYLRVTNDGRLETFAGTGRTGYAGDGGPAPDALLAAGGSAMGVANDATGRVYLADPDNHAIRIVDTDGTIGTYVVSPAP